MPEDTDTCVCGHERYEHDGECTVENPDVGFKCDCIAFEEHPSNPVRES